MMMIKSTEMMIPKYPIFSHIEKNVKIVLYLFCVYNLEKFGFHSDVFSGWSEICVMKWKDRVIDYM